MLRPNRETPWAGLRQCLAFLDFPFSLALDAVVSPVTVPLQIIHGDKDKFARAPLPDEKDPKNP